jgi:signal transduction histidine kinase
MLAMLCATHARPQAVDLDRSSPLQYIGKSVSYFKDTTALLLLPQAQYLYEKGKFVKGSSDILNLGNTASAFWIHLSIKKISDHAAYLVVGSANIEEIDCYIKSGDQWSNFKAGSLTKPTKGVRSTSQYIFPVSSSDGQTASDIWLRVKSRNIMLLPLQLAQADNLYLIENSSAKVIEICFIGFLLALLIFHAFLYLSVRDVAYLYYCLYILSLGIYTIGYLSGYSYLLGESFRSFVYRYPHIFFCIGFGTSILITNRFYNIRSLSLPLFRWTNLLLGGLCVLLVISLLGFKARAAWGAQVFGLIVPVTLIVTSIYAYGAERKTVAYLGAAWLTFVAAVIYYVLSLQGILEYTTYSSLILQSGILLEFMLLAIALGRRYELIIERQRKAEEENYKLIQTHNAELERQVSQRTQSLKDAIAKLQASDEIKNKLFSIIAHDLRTPFNGILTILSADNIDLFNEEELKRMLRSNSNHFQQLKVMLDNILHWARAQMQEVHINIERFDISQMISFLVAVYRPIAEEKKVNIRIEGSPQSLFCVADKNHIQLVLRNLLDNAVKYTVDSGIIIVKALQQEAMIEVSIQNDFMPSDAAGWGDSRVGLGISLCNDYLARNGSLLVKEIEGSRIRYGFQLPS